MQQASFFGSSPAIPIAGRTVAARAASLSGARQVVKTWTRRQSVMLQLIAGGSKSRQELAALSGYPINAVCSAIGNLVTHGQIEEDPHHPEIVRWDGDTVTVRTRFRLAGQPLVGQPRSGSRT